MERPNNNMDTFKIIRKNIGKNIHGTKLVFSKKGSKLQRSLEKVVSCLPSTSTSTCSTSIIDLLYCEDSSIQRCILVFPRVIFIDKHLAQGMDDIITRIALIKTNHLVVNCGPYKDVRLLEKILQFVMVVSDAMKTEKTTIFATNFAVCRRALRNVQCFYANPSHFQNDWRVFLQTVTRAERIDEYLRRIFGSSNAWKILEINGGGVDRKKFRGMHGFLIRLKEGGNEAYVEDIMNRWIYFAMTHQTLTPFRLQNNTKYKVMSRQENGVGSFEVTSASSTFKFVYSLGIADMDQPFLTALCVDFIDPTGCSRVIFADMPDALTNAMVSKNYTFENDGAWHRKKKPSSD